MSRRTPVLPCQDYNSIKIAPGASTSSSSSSSSNHFPIHPFTSPTFSIPPALSAHIDTAAEHIRDGVTVAMPTETVYGLAASSLSPSAVQRIYQIKRRPADNPLIMHISSLDMLRRILPAPHAYTMSRLYEALIHAFWPGPLTLLFPNPKPPPAPAPQTNAIRMPAHPLALALINAADGPLSAPSANSSGRPSPTRAQHVVNDLDGAEGLGCILDGGDCGVGVESTVVDGLGWIEGGGGQVNVLRPGGLGVEGIARVVEEVDGRRGATRILLHGKPWGEEAVASEPEVDNVAPIFKLPPTTPGMKYRHYSPRIPVYLVLPSNSFPTASAPRLPAKDLLARIEAEAGIIPELRIGVLHYADSPLFRTLSDHATPRTTFRSLGPDAISAAQALFSAMLEMEGRAPAGLQPPESQNGDERRIEQGRPEAAQPNGSDALGRGVDVILIEGCTDEGLGLAVMERVRKAVGGGGVLGEVSGEGGLRGADEGVFWVQV